MVKACGDLLLLSKESKDDVPVGALYVSRENGKFNWFMSQGCRHSSAGQCLMCNYGKGHHKISKSEMKTALDEIFKNYSLGEFIPFMFFGTNGSIFDEYEMSTECFDYLLDYISKYNIKNLYFETHYTTVTQEKLDKINSKLPNSKVYIELGFETQNPYVREKALLKPIDNEAFKQRVGLIHKNNCFVAANVLLGIPFLTEKESFYEALNSIDFLLHDVAVDEVVVFPLNIKHNTFLACSNFKSIHLLSLYNLIGYLSDEDIAKISFSMYDTHNDAAVKKPPITCEKCEEVVDILHKFMVSSLEERIALREYTLGRKFDCKCAQRIASEPEDERSLDKRISDFLEERIK